LCPSACVGFASIDGPVVYVASYPSRSTNCTAAKSRAKNWPAPVRVL
jgi:hypothetical protein